MTRSLRSLLPVFVAFVAVAAGPPLASVHVTTQHNDIARTGANMSESILKPSNVHENSFGKLFTLAVDGQVFAQPLYLSNVTIQGTARNVVFVATEHDSVYAFDADAHGALLNPKDPRSGFVPQAPLWRTNFVSTPYLSDALAPFVGPVVQTGGGAPLYNYDIQPEIGITGTPVIDLDPVDPSKSTLFVVAKTQEPDAAGNVAYVQRLHALDVTTGTERPGSPVVIGGTGADQILVPGTGTGSDGFLPPDLPGSSSDNKGHVVFNPLRQFQRSGLLLLDGVVYVPFASHADVTPYHGWLIGFDAKTFKRVAVFCVTPNGGRGGIWQGGIGPSSDGQSIFLTTGNGTFKPDGPNGGDWSDSLLRLTPAKSSTGITLAVADFFTPFNQATMESIDADFGSGSAIVLPAVAGVHPDLVVAAGKFGVIYACDPKNLGKYNTKADDVAQRIPALITDNNTPLAAIFGGPAYFNGSLYYLGARGGRFDSLKQFRFAGGLLPATATSRSRHQFANRSTPPSISANGAADGIVWVIEASGYIPQIPATLHAYDAADLSVEMYTSDQAVTYTTGPGQNSAYTAKRDQPGIGVKFATPTIANGKVFIGTKQEVTVYGHFPQ